MKPKLTWLLAPISLGAFLATWGGWAKLATMTGYAEVEMLSGQHWSTFNIGIVLPMTVEPFGALAMSVAFNQRVRRWARAVAGVMALATLVAAGLCQAVVHSLTVQGKAVAPDYVVSVTAVLPVIVLGLGGALAMLNAVRTGATETATATGPSAWGRIGRALGDAAAIRAERLAATATDGHAATATDGHGHGHAATATDGHAATATDGHAATATDGHGHGHTATATATDGHGHAATATRPELTAIEWPELGTVTDDRGQRPLAATINGHAATATWDRPATANGHAATRPRGHGHPRPPAATAKRPRPTGAATRPPAATATAKAELAAAIKNGVAVTAAIKSVADGHDIPIRTVRRWAKEMEK